MGLFSKVFGSFGRSAKANAYDQACLKEWGLSHVKVADCDAVLDLGPGGAISLPYDDETFDLVTVFEVHTLWPHPEKSIAEIKRVLRHGGRLLIAIGPSERKTCTANDLRRILREPDFPLVRIDEDRDGGRLAAVAVK